MENQQKTTLLSVTGLSPQVVTETLFALYQSGKPMPDQIVILSTTEGAKRARLTLIQDKWLERFFHDYQLVMPEAENIRILEITDDSGKALEDIRNNQDNEKTANCITETIRQLSSDEYTALHVSIAGGRKTMGFYAGYALSLYGRPQDRLSHVLVSANFESHPQFFYPTPYSKVIYANDKNSTPLDTKQAEVALAYIAFVRLRGGLDKQLLTGKSSFSASVQRAQQSLVPARLIINLKQKTLTANKQVIKLKPVDMAFYYWLIQNQLKQNPVHCPADGAPEKHYAKDFIHCYQQINGEMSTAERTMKTLQNGMEKSFFEQHKSAVNSAIKKVLDIHADNYLVPARGRRPYTEYYLKLDAQQIEYREDK